MLVQKHIIALLCALAVSACVTNAGTNPYHAAGAGQYVTPVPAHAETTTGNIHVIGGELHW